MSHWSSEKMETYGDCFYSFWSFTASSVMYWKAEILMIVKMWPVCVKNPFSQALFFQVTPPTKRSLYLLKMQLYLRKFMSNMTAAPCTGLSWALQHSHNAPLALCYSKPAFGRCFESREIESTTGSLDSKTSFRSGCTNTNSLYTENMSLSAHFVYGSIHTRAVFASHRHTNLVVWTGFRKLSYRY